MRGDHYVTLIVQVPTNLNSEAKEALRRFDELSGGSLKRAKTETEHGEKKKKSFKDKLKEVFDE